MQNNTQILGFATGFDFGTGPVSRSNRAPPYRDRTGEPVEAVRST